MPSKQEVSAVMADLGRRRWRGKTKAQMRAHMKMMADKATFARIKKKRTRRRKALDT